MTQILPSINCAYRDLAEAERKVRLASGFATMLHVDVADGAFTFHKSWNHPEAWRGIGVDTPFEVHLMVEDPLAAAKPWLSAGAKRIIVHAEVTTPELMRELTALAAEHGASVMLALSPESKAKKAEQYFDLTNEFQMLAVHPGPHGQRFLPHILEKITWIKNRRPDAIIEVDGGIDEISAALAIARGADLLVSDSFIFESEDPKAAYERLSSL